MRISVVLLTIALTGCLDPVSTVDDRKSPAVATSIFAAGASLEAPCGACMEILPAWAADGSLWYSDQTGGLARISPNGSVWLMDSVLAGVFSEFNGATPVEPALAPAGDAMIYAFGHHDGTADVEGTNLVYDSEIVITRYEAGNWSIVARFAPGSTSPTGFPHADRLFAHSAGEHVVVQWASPINGVVEYVVSSDGGRSFGDVQQAPAGRPVAMSETMNRIRVNEDGALSFGRLYSATPRPSANDYYLGERPGAGLLDYYVWDGEWSVASVPRVGDGPTHGKWGANTAWSPQLGHVFAWQAQDGRLHAFTSVDGLSWSEPTHLGTLPLGTNPWVEVHGENVTISHYSRTAIDGVSTAHRIHWTPGTEPVVEQLLDAGGFRTEHAGHAVREDGLVAYPVYDGSSLRFEFRKTT